MTVPQFPQQQHRPGTERTDWPNRWSEPPAALLPRRRWPRWVIGTAVIVGSLLAGGVGGWFLKPTPAPPTPSASPPAAAPMIWTPQQAKDRACNAFVVLGTEWSTGYHEWIATMQRPGWKWNDPDVASATDKFRPIESQVVSQLEALLAPNTPSDVANPIHRYTSAILEFAATYGIADGTKMTAQEDAIDSASAASRQACGLPPAP